MLEDFELYLVQSSMLKSLWKIGISKNPYERYDQLNNVGKGVERGWVSTHLLQCKFSVRKIETALHRKYAAYRLPQSEWFKLPKQAVEDLHQFMYDVEREYTAEDVANFICYNKLK